MLRLYHDTHPPSGTGTATASLSGCYRHRTPQGARQTASAGTEGTRCGSISCERVHTPSIGHRNGTQTASEDATGIGHHRAQDSGHRGHGGHVLRLYIMRARTHTLHRAQKRHTDRLRGCYRHRTPQGARQTASAATEGMCCGSISCERVHTPSLGHRNGTQTASEDATGIEHHRAQDSEPQRLQRVPQASNIYIY